MPVSSEFSGEEVGLLAGVWLLCTAPAAVVELQSIVALQKNSFVLQAQRPLLSLPSRRFIKLSFLALFLPLPLCFYFLQAASGFFIALGVFF